MHRLRLTLAATALTVAAAGGGLLIAPVSAAPAYAAATAAPAAPSAPAAPPGVHTVTITAQPAAPAASGISPHEILPCAVGQGPTPASCGQQTIECSISTLMPILFSDGEVYGNAAVGCDSEVTSIRMTVELLRDGAIVNNSIDTTHNDDQAFAPVSTFCPGAGAYTTTASALITFPPGYVLTGGSNPIHDTSGALALTLGPNGCTAGGDGGGGGGGGGCATTGSPSAAGEPAVRHPDVIVCP